MNDVGAKMTELKAVLGDPVKRPMVEAQEDIRRMLAEIRFSLEHRVAASFGESDRVAATPGNVRRIGADLRDKLRQAARKCVDDVATVPLREELLRGFDEIQQA